MCMCSKQGCSEYVACHVIPMFFSCVIVLCGVLNIRYLSLPGNKENPSNILTCLFLVSYVASYVSSEAEDSKNRKLTF